MYLEKIKNILNSLELNVQKETSDDLLVSIPLNRPDIEREIDIIEEIARINGYDNIPDVKKLQSHLVKNQMIFIYSTGKGNCCRIRFLRND
jgi:phenylalanyl-tRNA synthetase beta chain